MTVPDATAARRIAGFTSSLGYDDLPDDVVAATKLHLLDAIGCGLAAHALDVATAGRTVMASLGEGDASVIGLGRSLPAPGAAFANAMLCHGLDFDDTHSDCVCHITVVVGTSSLAVGESSGASGRDVLAAVAAGTEVVARIGMTASGLFHARGFHPTSVCGVFGAAAAAARLAELDAETTTHALGIAGSMSSGLLAFLNDGTPTKPIHAAIAAQNGILASELAAHGAAGPAGVLEGRYGLFDAFLGVDAAGLSAQLDDLGSRWETLRIAFKPYPACHFMHGSLGATASLLDRVSPDGIEEVVVTIPEPLVPVVLEPVDVKLAPRTEYEGKFSLQYSTAAMLVHGEVTLGTYTAEALADPAVRELAAKVSYEARPFETYPSAFPGGVRIRTTDGRVLEAELPYQLGAPQNPMGEAQVRAKFRANAGLALGAGQVEELEESLLALDDHDDVRSVLALVAARELAA